MELDYIPKTGFYTLKVPRSESALVNSLMMEHGLDFNARASTAAVAVLATREPYAAASFLAHATPGARLQLGGMASEIEASFAASSNAHIKCPADRELWPFQRADISYALRRQNTLIGDQPGLGKTPVAVCFANEISARRVLVVCPANIRMQWVKRIREWTTLRWPFVVHPILSARNGVHPAAHWTVVSYDLARTPEIGAALAKGTYDLLILDEAHYLKEITSKRTQAFFGGGRSPAFPALASRCGAVLALTGTPLPNRPAEAFTLAKGLCWDAIDWMSQDAFNERFNPRLKIERVNPETGRTSFFIDERTGRTFELQNRLRANFMTRHMKREVMSQLKMPVFDIIQMEETGPVRQALAAEKLLDIDPETLTGADIATQGHIAVVRRMMGIALAPQVVDYVKVLIDGGEEKLVVFAWHIEVLNILQAGLAKHGVVRIDGSVGPTKKQRLVDEFIVNPKLQVIIGNIQSMGTGTDGLQFASNHALICEPSWQPGENEQCFDRLDRGGQTRTVQGDILVAPGSLAERILSVALRKLAITNKALDRRM